MREISYIRYVFLFFCKYVLIDCYILRPFLLNQQQTIQNAKGCSNIQSFRKWDEGVRFLEMFKPIPVPAIALVLTAVRIVYIH